ncbi:enterochelin esterase [Streptomyces bathyalis]|uniref:Enterochelin esterase n=1 Tax=Streptomyces bathyalis TaxID=2710756 RepID=A0A7T1T9D3_9ACTN|nr:enterochelin esterase [Streptomyces bathyalis]QPP08811.1 enterochelin esterase [Streptomyces bathyalis]
MFAPETSIVSPRIARVAQAVEAGNHDALDELWKEVAESGAPLMEQVGDDESRTLVTFLWRDPGDTENVLVLFFSAPSNEDFSEYRMENLPGTDLWYKSYFLPSDLRTTYLFSVNDPMVPFTSYAEVLGRLPAYRTDPLNPADYTLLGNPNTFKVSVLELPGAPKQPWNIARRGVPRGKTHMHSMDSSILGTKHHISVYVPPGYDTEGEEYNVFLLFDGWSYYNFASITTVMDNLIYTGRIPPYVLVMHTNEDQDIRARELPCHEPFNEFLVQELMPWVHENYHITSDPARTVLGGSCFGGLAAAYSAFKSPERFGNVISQSGSFWWPGKDNPDFEDEWMTKQYAESPRLPVRFSMDIGSLERAIMEYDPMTTHRNMRDVLQEKGYEVDYFEYTGGHDMVCWRGSIVDRLISFHPKPKGSTPKKQA